MKEKETATCPICGGELQIQGQALFKEHHKKLWKAKARQLGFMGDYMSFGETWGYNKFYSPPIPEAKPFGLIRWEKQNPAPELDLTWFVVSLVNRVAALEAALAEKGGQR